MSLGDSIFIFGLALIIFGPKKLPEIARQLGKIMHDFRRASNEFKLQFEEELRTSELADRQKPGADSTAVTPMLASDIPTVSSEPLTVRPPSTGTTESTDSPYKAVDAQDEMTDTGEEDWTESGTYDDVSAEGAEQTDSSAAINPTPSPELPAVSSEPLTVRPPSTGTTESTASPCKAVDAQDEMTDTAAGEHDWTESGTYDDATAGGTEQTDIRPHEPVTIPLETAESTASERNSGIPEGTAVAPAMPGSVPYTSGEDQADDYQDLQEQATNHHG